MRSHSLSLRTSAVVFAVFALLLRAPAAAPEPQPAALGIGLGPGSSLWLEGKSSLHDFEAKSAEVHTSWTRDAGAADPADAAALLSLIRGSTVRGLDLDVPVASLRSGKDGLDKNMYKSLNASKYPTIHFHLLKYAVGPHGNAPDTLEVRAEGMLTIAGSERPDTLEARLFKTGEGLILEGREGLLMSDYGIKPPTMMMGTIRVQDHVVVGYRLLLAPHSAAANAVTGAH